MTTTTTTYLALNLPLWEVTADAVSPSIEAAMADADAGLRTQPWMYRHDHRFDITHMEDDRAEYIVFQVPSDLDVEAMKAIEAPHDDWCGIDRIDGVGGKRVAAYLRTWHLRD